MALWSVQSAVESSGKGAEPGALRPVVNATLCIGCGSCIEACPEKGTLALVGGKAILAHPERCKAHASCVSACPTSGISMSADGAFRTLRVPKVSQNFETNVPGLFIVGELGGMGLIKTSINEGRLVADHLVQRLQAQGPAPDGAWDVIIVGAGPAGLSASLTLHHHEFRYLTLEQGEVASTIRNYPRHKFLMAEPLEMPLYGNLYIADGTKEALLEVWETIIANTGVQIRTNEKVESVMREEASGLLKVRTSEGEHRARFVVLAIGKRGTPRKLGVVGENQSHVAYRLIEADSYDGDSLLLVGGGDSAIEAALGLAKGGRNRVTLVHRGSSFDRARERNRTRLEEAEAEARIEVCRNARVKEIGKRTALVEADGVQKEVAADYVFIFAGGESPEDFLCRSGVEIVEKAVVA
ncbi:MAG: NAD(P)-binding domain-containing protein [Acidobacteria bacterium]|nr:NAD(P)-binding domain-containing protein [Acidobacteriota bacterium]